MTALRGFLLCLLLLAPFASGGTFGAAIAQTSNTAPLNYDDWDRVALRAENATTKSAISDQAFQDLRRELVDWREVFADAGGINAVRLETVQAQLDSLGPAPDNGAEALEISEKRRVLNSIYSDLSLPGQKAQLAYSHANGLIAEIDQLLRARDSGKFFHKSPSPLSPNTWKAGRIALQNLWTQLGIEIKYSLKTADKIQVFRSKIPLIIALLLFGGVLMLRGRRWMEHLTARILGDAPSSGRYLVGFFISFGQIIIPFFGFVLFLTAVQITDLGGHRSAAVLNALSSVVLGLLLARWLALKIFPIDASLQTILTLPDHRRREGRYDAVALGGLLGLFGFFREMVQYEGAKEAAKVALLFPILVAGSVFLFRIGYLIVLDARDQSNQSAEVTFRRRVSFVVGRIIMFAAGVGPVLAVIGYARASAQITFPFVSSLALIAFLFLLQNLVREVYALALGNRESANNALWPVLIGLTMAILSLPVFALIWGVRWTALQDIWQIFVAGFALGEAHISPILLLKFAVIFAAGYAATKLVQGALGTSVLPKTKLDAGGQTAVVSGVGYLGIGLAALIAISATGIDLTGFALVAGALSVGIGFGLQTIVSNFVAGIILLIERPISEGDWIEVGTQMGVVRNISVRATRIETFDRTDVIVPNSDLVSGVVTNWTRGNLIGRLILPVGVAYGTDTKQVEALLLDIAQSHPMVVADPAPAVLFRNFGADSLDFEIRAILRDVNWKLNVQSDLNHEIARRFAEENIEIPFAQRDVWLRNPETLNAAAKTGNED